MVILMKNDKTLINTQKSRLYQKESAVDKMVFYLPEFYEENDLRDFVTVLNYTDPSNAVHSELLEMVDESDKEGFIQYKLPVTTKITALPGNISLYLSLVHADQETDTKYVMKTSVLTIKIDTWDDYFKYVSDESLSAIDDKFLQLDNELAKLKTISDVYSDSQPDDLTIDSDGLLQLSANGNAIGDGVNVVVNPTDVDGQLDGVLDLDSIADGSGGGDSGGGTTPSAIDLTVNQDGLLQVTQDGTPVGNGVDVVVNPTDADGTNDGVLDLDSLMGI